MIKKIAVLSDDTGAPTSLILARDIIVYVRLEKEWQEEERYSIRDVISDTPISMKILSERLADKLGSLKIILGSNISGAQYMALNRSGFLICESEGISDDFFDELFAQLAADKDVLAMEKALSGQSGNLPIFMEQTEFAGPKVPVTPKVPITPTEDTERPGYYFINLFEVQRCNPLLSTKKILRPFLSGTPFVELGMLCDHEPPWLEFELPGMGLEWTALKTETDFYTVTITHKLCSN